MSERLSTAGMSLQYAVETTKGERPTTGYQIVPEVKTMPSFNPTPNTIQSTTLLETEYHTYVKGLKDLGGALEYGANLTQDLLDFWNKDLINAYNEATANGLSLWWTIVHPKLNDSIYFVGEPSPISFNEADVDAMTETTLYVTPNSAPEWHPKPTAEEDEGGGEEVQTFAARQTTARKNTEVTV